MLIWPLIVSSDGYISVYQTRESLDREDAAEFTFGRHEVYDAEGRKGRLTVRQFQLQLSPDLIIHVGDWESEPTHAKELEELLRAALSQIGERAPPDWTLARLIEEASSWFGGD